MNEWINKSYFYHHGVIEYRTNRDQHLTLSGNKDLIIMSISVQFQKVLVIGLVS
jgi:hypothetical protein